MASKLNKILYGPPGTGKTFHSISYAIAICDNKGNDYITKCLNGTQDRAQVLKRFRELLSSGRIRFITFHQSLGYEDFILGIKPKLDEANSSLKYELVEGIFYKLCEDAKKELLYYEEQDDVDEDELENENNNIGAILNDNRIIAEVPQISALNDEKRNLRERRAQFVQPLKDLLNGIIDGNIDSINTLISNWKTFVEASGYNFDGGYYNCILDETVDGKKYCVSEINANAVKIVVIKDDIVQAEGRADRNTFENFKFAIVIKLAGEDTVRRIEGLTSSNATNLNKIVEHIINLEANQGARQAINLGDNAQIVRTTYQRVLNEIVPINTRLKEITKELRNPTLQGDNRINVNLPAPAFNNPVINQEESTVNIANFVLIIDEINRGNVPNIFGELITLIEDSKRVRKYNIEGVDDNGKNIYKAELSEEALELTIPNTDKKFSVPANVHIVGTMNTADRSVEALDTALRRRFDFIPMPPNPGLLTYNLLIDGTPINLQKVLKCINGRIEALIDSDHAIGHSFFINVKDRADLIDTFKNNIIPLLQEYFYGNAERIGWVLGKGFVEAAGDRYTGGFAEFGNIDEDLGKPSISIKNLDDNFPIVDAIRLLIN
jgi:hypothetical protein